MATFKNWVISSSVLMLKLISVLIGIEKSRLEVSAWGIISSYCNVKETRKLEWCYQGLETKIHTPVAGQSFMPSHL